MIQSIPEETVEPENEMSPIPEAKETNGHEENKVQVANGMVKQIEG